MAASVAKQGFGVQFVPAPGQVSGEPHTTSVVTVQVPAGVQHAPVGTGQVWASQSAPAPSQVFPAAHAAWVVIVQAPVAVLQQAPVGGGHGLVGSQARPVGMPHVRSLAVCLGCQRARSGRRIAAGGHRRGHGAVIRLAGRPVGMPDARRLTVRLRRDRARSGRRAAAGGRRRGHGAVVRLAGCPLGMPHVRRLAVRLRRHRAGASRLAARTGRHRNRLPVAGDGRTFRDARRDFTCLVADGSGTKLDRDGAGRVLPEAECSRRHP